MPEPRRIGLLGGTFDPVHLGHLDLARAARDALRLDEVRFLPCQISPHKTGAAPAASPDDRLAMLSLALRDIDWAVVDDQELRRSGPSYSYQSAEALASPAVKLFWIMGCDQWLALPQWRHPERLAQCVEFIVRTRNQAPQPRPGYLLHPIHGSHPAAATTIRHAIANHSPTPPWLHPDVAQWIHQHHLYQHNSEI